MKKVVFWGLLVSLVIAACFSLFASTSPDGLEKVAERLGFQDKEKELFRSPIPGYVTPGVANDTIATALAGTVGTVAIFGVAYGVGKLVKKRTQSSQKKET